MHFGRAKSRFHVIRPWNSPLITRMRQIWRTCADFGGLGRPPKSLALREAQIDVEIASPRNGVRKTSPKIQKRRIE